MLFNPPVFGGSILAVFLNPTTTLEKQFDRGVFPGGARSPAALVVVSGWFPSCLLVVFSRGAGR